MAQCVWTRAVGTYSGGCLAWPRFFQVGWFAVFRLPTTIAGALFLACGVIVIASVIENVYQYNHDPILRLRQKQAFLVAMRQTDERSNSENKLRGILPPRPEGRSGAPVETQIAKLKKQIAKQRAVLSSPP